MFDRNLFMDRCLEIARTAERETLIQAVVKNVSGFGWETANYGQNPDSTMESLTRSVADTYISLMCVNALFRVNPREVGKYVSRQLGGNSDGEVDHDWFVNRCAEIGKKYREGLDLGEHITGKVIGWCWQVENYGRHPNCSMETLERSIADMYISLMCAMQCFEVDSDEVDRHIAEQLGIKRFDDMDGDELFEALTAEVKRFREDGADDKMIAKMLGIHDDSEENE